MPTQTHCIHTNTHTLTNTHSTGSLHSRGKHWLYDLVWKQFCHCLKMPPPPPAFACSAVINAQMWLTCDACTLDLLLGAKTQPPNQYLSAAAVWLHTNLCLLLLLLGDWRRTGATVQNDHREPFHYHCILISMSARNVGNHTHTHTHTQGYSRELQDHQGQEIELSKG